MRACGIELKGNTAVLVAVDGSKEQFELLNVVKKIELAEMYDNAAIEAFYSEIKQVLEANEIECVVIKKRGEKGRFAGGPASFKMEGLIQLAASANTSFISGPQITALLKKNPELPLPKLSKYQEQAFYAAFSQLSL